MYYYGARYYDPRISIFVSVDPLAEQTMTPYQYVNNNPINLIDPTGMSAEGPGDGNKERPSWVSRAWSEVKSWFTSDKKRFEFEFGEVTNTLIPDYEPSPTNQQASFGAVGATLGTAGTIEGVGGGSAIGGIGSYLSSVVPHVAVLVGAATLAQGDTRREDPGMYLYRGVSYGHPDYANALQGMAVPAGINGGHNDSEAHNTGSYNSIFTSWTTARSVADYHANKGSKPGVVLMKKFMPNQTVPSPDAFDELEVLVPGVVRGADVQRPLGKGSPTAF